MLFRGSRKQSVSSAATKSSLASLCTTARVEDIACAEEVVERCTVASFDSTLDDDVQEVGCLPLTHNHCAGAEIADVDALLQYLRLIVSQTVEQRAQSVEALHRLSCPDQLCGRESVPRQLRAKNASPNEVASGDPRPHKRAYVRRLAP